MVDGTIQLGNNSIESMGDTLYLQKDRLADLDIMGGTIVIRPDGNVMINGNLTLTGDLTVGGVLGASTIKPTNGNLTLDIGNQASGSSSFGTLLIRGSNKQIVASIDSSGNINTSGDLNAQNVYTESLSARSATLSGTLAAQKLYIADTSAFDATGSALPSQATIGTATISAGMTEVTVTTSNVTQNSYIYITPITNTNDHVIFLKSKDPGNGFTVGLNIPLAIPIEFNWWVVN